jgi:hypothetical protein
MKQAGQLAAVNVFFGKNASAAGDTAYWTAAANDIVQMLNNKPASSQFIQPWMTAGPMATYEAEGHPASRALHGVMASTGAYGGTRAGDFVGGMAGHGLGRGAAAGINAAMSRFGYTKIDPEQVRFLSQLIGGNLGSSLGRMHGAQTGAELGQHGAGAITNGVKKMKTEKPKQRETPAKKDD